MARQNLTKNKRAFGKDPKTFLDASGSPLEITLESSDSTSTPVKILVRPSTKEIMNGDELATAGYTQTTVTEYKDYSRPTTHEQ